MAKKNKPITLERLLSILGIAVSLIALYFSWQANRIAEEQTRSNVLAISLSYLGAAQEHNFGNAVRIFGCTEKLRLANIGGAPASLVKWQANLYYNGQFTSLVGEQPYSLNSANLNNQITSFMISFMDSDTEYSPAELKQTFPIQIPPYSVVEVLVKANITVAGDTNFFYPPYDYYAFVEQGEENYGLDPVEITLGFTTSVNQEVSESPRAICIYMRPKSN